MFECKIPLFNPAPLRKEILESMRNLALLEQNARYSEYSDGILSGCGLYEKEMKIGVTGGLVKFAQRVYVLPERSGVEYTATDTWTVLKIQFGTEKQTRDFRIYEGRLALSESTNILPNEIELGRFKLKQGSRLRTKYMDFQDMETEYDTVNLVNVPYAGIGEHTLCPIILTNFANEAYPHAADSIDISFAMSCLASSGEMSRDSIKQYLRRRLNMSAREFDNREMHYHLANILAQIKGVSRQTGKGEQEGLLLL